MKKALFIVCACLLFAGTAYAGGMSVDASGNVLTEPASGFGTGAGANVGFNIGLEKLGVTGPAAKGIEARASLGFNTWERDVAGITVDFQRIPLVVGGRYVFPIEAPVKYYTEVGLELSFDKVEANVGGVKVTERDTRVGVVPSVGFDYPLSDQVTVGLNAAYHVITDSYFSIGFRVGLNLAP